MNPFKSISSTYRELGFVSGTIYLLDQLLKRMSADSGIFYYGWTVQPITGERILEEKRASKYNFKVLAEGDPAFEEMPIFPEILEHRFRQSAECIALYKGETLIGFIWFSYASYIEDEVRIDFMLQPPQESVFDFNLYIFPKYRLSYAFAAIWDSSNRYLYERGIRYTYSRITHIKLNSATSHDKLGAIRIGSSITLKLARLELTLVTSPCKLFASFKEGNRLPVVMSPEALSRPD